MAADNEFRLQLYTSLDNYARRRSFGFIQNEELLNERFVLITGRWTQAKAILLHELYEITKKNTKNSFFHERFDYTSIVNELAVKVDRWQTGYVFIVESIRFPLGSFSEEMSKLHALFTDYPNFSFFIGTDFGDFKNVSQSTSSLFDSFKVAELISIEELKQQKIPFVEEEIVQEQKKAPTSKRKARQFQPTSTKYDEVFRKIINGPEFSRIKDAQTFLLLKQQHNLKVFSLLQNVAKNNPDFKNKAKALENKFSASKSDVDQFGKDFPDNEIWITIMLLVNDLSLARFFVESRILADELTSAPYKELEREWTLDLLRFLISDNDVVNNATLINYFNFFETPSSHPYIFDVSVKQKILAGVFGIEYESKQFTPVVWGYFESLGPINVSFSDNIGIFISAVLLHPEIKAIWDIEEQTQAQTLVPPTLFNDGRVIGQYSPDEASEIDHLGFKHDVHALAALVAYDKTPLPLAIGLFGNWGSGKSSFMKQLEKRIEVLSKEQHENKELVNASKDGMPYCSNIAHITFNAWHYSDANLWASMMVHIFDQLLAKISVSRTREELREELIKKLSIASDAVIEAEKRVAETSVKLTEAKEILSMTIDRRPHLEKELSDVKLSMKDVAGALWKDKQFNSTMQELIEETGYEKAVQTKEEFVKWKKEMDSFGERLARAYTNLYRTNKLYAILILALPPLAALLLILLKHYGVLANINATIVTLSVSVLPVLQGTIKYVRKLNISLGRIESLEKEKTIKKDAELKEKEKQIRETIRQHEAIVNDQLKEVEIAKKNEVEAKAALEAIDINRQLNSFIQQRQGGNSYQQHLGIISLIRKDFEELRTYLNNCREEKKGTERSIDRIVLYIDDLDRCKTDRVVAVLEAVHLLLAIDLFVVVVGVDPRWVSKALKEQYKEQLHLDAAEDSDTSRLPGQRATPFDYLEKIFQVPFVLRSMNNDGAKKLLDNLFKGQVKPKDSTLLSTYEAFDNAAYVNAVAPMLGIDASGNAKTGLTGAEAIDKAMKTRIEKEKNRKEEEAKKEFIQQVENLSISEEELEFMKNISPIIGSTPRTVKRYGNLYRLLRVHSDLPNYSIDKLEVYQSVMLLLSISVSNGSIARPFFTALRESKQNGFYEMNKELIASIQQLITAARNKMEEKDEDEKEKEDALHEQMQTLNQLHTELGKLPDEIKNFSVATLKKYSPVVSRFSFRTLNCLEEETALAKA
jgi:hypothetical protein